MRFYLSFFAVSDEFKQDRSIESLQQSFLQEISASEHEYYDGSIYTDYPIIFKEIEKSDALVALIDNYWTSSTWKAIELWYAAGASAENQGKFISSPLICYLYCNNIKSINLQNILKLDNVREFDGTFDHLLLQNKET